MDEDREDEDGPVKASLIATAHAKRVSGRKQQQQGLAPKGKSKGGEEDDTDMPLDIDASYERDEVEVEEVCLRGRHVAL